MTVEGRQNPTPSSVFDLIEPVYGTTIPGAGSNTESAISEKDVSFIEGTELTNLPGPNTSKDKTYHHVSHVCVDADSATPEYHGYFYPHIAEVDWDTEAWKLYKWYVPNTSGNETLEFTFSGDTTGLSGMQVALAKEINSIYVWQWFTISSGEVNVTDIEDYIVDDYLLMWVMLTRSTYDPNKYAYDPTILESITIDDQNDPEIGGAGGAEFISTQIQNVSMPIYYVSLPAAASLAGNLPSPRDHETSYSSAANAFGDGALNLELQKIYGYFGWDNTDEDFRVSARQLHIATGKYYGIDQVFRGREHDDMLNYLVSYGVTVEDVVPWLDPTLYTETAWYTYSMGVTDNDNLLLLDVEDYWYLDIDEDTYDLNPTYWDAVILANVKATIAHQQRGVVFRRADVSGDYSMMIVGYDDTASGGCYYIRDSETGAYFWEEYDEFKGYDLAVILEEYNSEAEDAFLGTTTTNPPPVRLEASKGTIADEVVLDWECEGSPYWYIVYRDYPGNQVGLVTSAYESWTDSSPVSGSAHAYWVEAVYDPMLMIHYACAYSRPVLGWEQ